ncbi:FAD-binding oxidoreductase [Nonomuraea soli]|uniref:FAD/FMN-containing dehydrogenase n=1 Tax=Nonomuraea soli TaxID=1032476 RepID=A0A7W0CHM8_9ACTN|nr:FAD-binding oxidoreductase [Nonomuraea soli]MBA2891209.1 FAD/FMN-containing dehydrogenase [Nonomuraea soli]
MIRNASQSGGAGTLPARAWQDLARRVAGVVLVDGASGYEAAFRPAGQRFGEVRPQAVLRCRTASDVAAALDFARRNGLPVAVRSGGHDFAGRSTTAGLLIDLGELTAVSLKDGHAHIGAGTRLAEVYQSLDRHARTLAAGSGPSVAIAGLTLGGGLGFLGRSWGLTCDRLVGARVVLADGSLVRCDERENADLFWALRGGGAAGVGVVTELSFVPVPSPRCTAVEFRWDFLHAVQVVDAWQRWSPDAPGELAVSLLLTVPAEPYGQARVSLLGVAAGLSPARTHDLLAELVAMAGARPYSRWHRRTSWMDAQATLAARVQGGGEDGHLFSRSGFFRQDIPSGALDVLIGGLVADRRAGESRELDFTPWGGAYNRPPSHATAFPHRSERFLLKHTATLRTGLPLDNGWLRRSWQTVQPWSSGGVYPNFPDAELADPARSYWGDNLPRLERVKAAYDPDGILPGLNPRR